MIKNFGEQLREEDVFTENNSKAWEERLQQAKEYSTEVQNEVAEIQQAKLGIALRRLMQRSENNPEIANNLNELLDGLEHQSGFGDSSENISPARQKDLAEFLGEAAKALRWSVGGGNRSTEKIDLKKWSQ